MLDATDLLAEMVAIPSVNPLLPGALPGDDEQNVAAFIAGHLRSGGAEVELQEVKDGRCNVIAHAPRSGDADDAVILMTGHMDTYPAGGPRSGYELVREDAALYGRGSADAKGPLAAMVTAFLLAARSPSRREAYVVATVDEECLLMGARQLVSHHMRPTLAITGEPTSLVPVTSQKGIIRGSLKVRGAAGHAAYPKGDTAIDAVARLVDAVHRLNQEYANGPAHPVLGVPTMTVTKIQSGGGMNLVAEEVTVWFDARFLPGTSGERFAREVETALRAQLPGQDLVMDALNFISPANACVVDNPVVSEFFAQVEAVTGACEPEGFAYGSEAGVLAEICDSSLVFGPGDARYSHGQVEMIDAGELDAATEIFRRLLVPTSDRGTRHAGNPS
ncbi:M20/M25/M40 family metallo-hydrolase [Nonomuraea sp. NPDC050691]|uniref:M20 family metallopeptidase n=1 Tax=Nonomuraea sp. NPDC050691 TaxID=3155661 RepID=UPI003403D29B